MHLHERLLIAAGEPAARCGARGEGWHRLQPGAAARILGQSFELLGPLLRGGADGHRRRGTRAAAG